jgi:lipopolysaccharide/colanic/teichoic acid biosynthesis glycosyltransferase
MPDVTCDHKETNETFETTYITSRISRFEAKVIRVMDFTIALTALVLSIPLMALIAVIIKIDSPGQVIFKQIRMGKDRRGNKRSKSDNENAGDEYLTERRRRDMYSRPFVFYKFRTMHAAARERFPELYNYEYDKEEINNFYFKVPDDPRLTRFGRHLRKTTLDEIPNLINVIKGDMGLVGPRPDIPEMIKYYQGWQKIKFRIPPGVTGLAQVNGRGILSFSQTLRFDADMVEKYGFWFNIKIILKTIKVSILRIGAF